MELDLLEAFLEGPMRRIVSWEGEEKVPGVILEVGSMHWPKAPVPVVWEFNHTDIDKMLGKASDFQREEDGSITAEITLSEDTETQKHAKALVEHGDVAFTTWANQLVETRGVNPRLIHEAHIKSVSMVLSHSVGWE